LEKRAPVHNIARLGTQPNVIEMVDGKMRRAVKRPLLPKDNTLMVALG